MKSTFVGGSLTDRMMKNIFDAIMIISSTIIHPRKCSEGGFVKRNRSCKNYLLLLSSLNSFRGGQ